MTGLKEFRINIAGLSNKIHEFDYHIGKSFFESFKSELVQDADLTIKVLLDKHETFLDADFSILGNVSLICDRSLDSFEERLEINGRILFKYADRTEEISEEIMHIHRDTEALDLSQFIFDFIGTSLPMKRLHPRFRDEAEEGEGKIVWSSGSAEEPETDPRWEKLKNLNKR
ncbi:MAG: YceD family protein [Cyclobacteriaceae bacterium]